MMRPPQGAPTMPNVSTAVPVQIRNLGKTYPGGIEAVKEVSLQVEAGETVALLGPNGAGKSTVLKVLASLSVPTDGEVMICGCDVQRERKRAIRQIGFVGQSTSYDGYATPQSHLRLYAQLYGLDGGATRRIDDLLKRFGLEDVRRRRVATLSGGTKRRLDILTAMIHDPVVLILDEPTTGLDPTSRRDVWKLIDELKSALGIAVLFTTHYLDEADQHATRVVVIDEGTIIAQGPPEVLKAQTGGDTLAVQLDPDADGEAARRVVDGVTDAIRTSLTPGMLHVVVRDARTAIVPVLNALTSAGLLFNSVEVRRPSLSEVYFSLTGKAFSADEPSTT